MTDELDKPDELIMTKQKGKCGRPRSRISTNDFVRRKLHSLFVGYLLERLFCELEDSGFVSRDEKGDVPKLVEIPV